MHHIAPPVLRCADDFRASSLRLGSGSLETSVGWCCYTPWLTKMEVENYLFLEEPRLPSGHVQFPC